MLKQSKSNIKNLRIRLSELSYLANFSYFALKFKFNFVTNMKKDKNTCSNLLFERNYKKLWLNLIE